MKKLKIGLAGSENLKELLAKVMDQNAYEFIDLEPKVRKKNRLADKAIRLIYFTKNIHKIDVLYCIFIRKNTWIYTRIANLAKKKVVYHWVGTDLYNVEKGMYHFGEHNEKVELHFSYAQNLHDELEGLGISNTILPIVPADIDVDVSIMPKEHAVLISIPDDAEGRAEFYGYKETVELIKAFPTLPFYVTRSTHPEKYNYPNVRFKGVLSSSEMNELYNNISIIIRLPEHDGQSLLLMEGTIKGKYMIYNHNLPYTIKVQNVEEAKTMLTRILSKPPELQKEEREYGLNKYNIKECRQQFDEVIGSLITQNNGK